VLASASKSKNGATIEELYKMIIETSKLDLEKMTPEYEYKIKRNSNLSYAVQYFLRKFNGFLMFIFCIKSLVHLGFPGSLKNISQPEIHLHESTFLSSGKYADKTNLLSNLLNL